MKKQLEKHRDWQGKNTDWELICDMKTSERLYVQWHELPKDERMSWIGQFGSDAKDAFDEFGTKRCKVERKCLTESLVLCDPLDWPPGFNMLVFRTSIDGVRVI